MSVVPSLGLKTPRNTLMAICLSLSEERNRQTKLFIIMFCLGGRL